MKMQFWQLLDCDCVHKNGKIRINGGGASFTACAVFVILYNRKLYNSGVFRGGMSCTD